MLAAGTAWAPSPAPGDIAAGRDIGFPIIIFEGEVWLLKTDAQFEEIRAAGFNIMQTYDMATSDDDANEWYLDRAQAHSLRVMPTLNRFFEQKDDVWTLDEAALAAFVGRWSDYPAIWGWSLDEPDEERIPVELQRRYYAIVKGSAGWPSRYATTVYACGPGFDAYFAEDAFDILMLDIYPYVGTAPPRRVDLIAQRMSPLKALRQRDYPIVPVLQAFGDYKWWEPVPPTGVADQWAAYREAGAADGIAYFAWVSCCSNPAYLRDNPPLLAQVKSQNERIIRNLLAGEAP